jgi:hypothetical protein
VPLRQLAECESHQGDTEFWKRRPTCPSNVLQAYLLDIVGRRLLLSGGLMGCVVSLIVEAACVATFSKTGSTSASRTAAAFLFVHVSARSAFGLLFVIYKPNAVTTRSRCSSSVRRRTLRLTYTSARSSLRIVRYSVNDRRTASRLRVRFNFQSVRRG